MTEHMKGEIALVTGASRGIGAAIADELAARGATVIGTATSDAGAHAIGERLAAVGGHGRRLNVNEAGAIEALIDAIGSEFGGVSILVNNAGITRDNLLMRMKDEDWQAILDTNLTSVYRASKAVMRGMMKARRGRIVNIASVYGLAGGVDRSSYVASKHALVGLTKAVALETATTAITCNAVCPGDVSTRIFYRNAKLLAEREQITRAEAQQRIAATNMPSGRVASPEQVAALVAFLCTEAADEIRGAALPMDGAWLAR